MAPPPEADGDDPLSYRAAGVDIEAGQRLVERIKPAAQRTRRCEVLSALGGFGALFELPLARCSQPVLVAGADGVGTKLALARQLGGHRGVGIDLVAMCVNDILTQGAEPLFFLDYFASGKLDVDNAAEVVEGIADGCQQAGAALIGGETAEMPGMYAPGDYDLAGFAVGVVDKPRMLDAHDVRADDVLIGLASSGPHSNGYSLIRRILADQATDLNEPFDGATLGQRLLEPTRIYVEALLPLLGVGRIKALAHITGGGLTDNLPRVLPAGCAARVEVGAWPRPEVFAWLKQAGRLAEAELLHTFNCGIGMVAITAPAHGDAILERAQALALPAWPIGRVIATEDEPAVRYV